MSRTLLHLGGNGHASTRLDLARAALSRRTPAIELVDLPYPGFEGRPPCPSLDAFFETVASSVQGLANPPVAAYASGIGALIALGLRARGVLSGTPLILQGPVLWGLKERAFPKVMRRVPFARRVLKFAFGTRIFQRRFVRKHFERPLDASTSARFFEGYLTCASFSDFFDWFTPDWLVEMEQAFSGQAHSLEKITIWTGGKDHVVGMGDVLSTERALGVTWPVVTFPTWGHYPMIDVPKEWADALCRTLDEPGPV